MYFRLWKVVLVVEVFILTKQADNLENMIFRQEAHQIGNYNGNKGHFPV